VLSRLRRKLSRCSAGPSARASRPEGRLDLIEELENNRRSARPRLSLATVEPKPLPLTAVEMERHTHSFALNGPDERLGLGESAKQRK
jgi:hypothetical protein